MIGYILGLYHSWKMEKKMENNMETAKGSGLQDLGFTGSQDLSVYGVDRSRKVYYALGMYVMSRSGSLSPP